MSNWVLLPGAASGPEVFSRQHHVLRGARSWVYETPAEPVDLLSQYASAVHRQVAPPLVLVGHSMGGAVAQLMALEHPDAVVGLILIGTGPHLPVNPALLTGLETDPSATLARIAGWSLTRTADPRLADECRKMMLAVPPALAHAQFAACAAFDIRSRRGSDRIKVHAIVGDDDRMTPPTLVESLTEVWPTATVHRIAGAGHLVMLEQPDAVNALLAQLHGKWG